MIQVLKKSNYRKYIFTIAIPIMMQNLVLQIQNIINRAFLGNQEPEYLSALGNAIFPFSLTTATVMSICIGTTILIAQNYGAQNLKKAKEYAEASIAYNSLVTLILFLIWFLLPKYILVLTGVEKGIAAYSAEYIRILSFSMIFYGIDISCQAILQGVGITKPIMYAGFVKVGANVFFNWTLIYGNLGFPKMGITGAALASTMANFISACLVIKFVIFSKIIPFSLSLRCILSSSFKKFVEVAKLGIPSGLETLLWHIANLVTIKFLNSIDKMAVGIYTMVFTIDILAYVIYNAIGKSAITIIGHKIGEKQEHDYKNVVIQCLKYNFFIVAIISFMFLIFSKQILSIFSSSNELITRAVPLLVIVSFIIYPKSVNAVVGNGIRATGDTKWMLYSQMIGTAFVIITMYITIYCLHLNLKGLFIVIFLDELLRAIINSIKLFKMKDLKHPLQI